MNIILSLTFTIAAIVISLGDAGLFDNNVDKVLDLDYLEATSRFSFMDDDISAMGRGKGDETMTDHGEGIEINDESSVSTLWYPDYDTPWMEAGCQSFIPSTYEEKIHSDRPHYSSQLECCQESYPEQPGDACIGKIISLKNRVVAYIETSTKSNTTTSSGPNMLTNQVICGYQGWFGTPGDGSHINRWRHWFRGNESAPAYDRATIDMYPTTDEYDSTDLVESGIKMPDGTYAKFFSSFKPNVVLKHFEWMQTYGITGVFHHRFMSGLQSAKENATRTQITRNVINAAEATGRKFAMSYDIAGTGNEMMERLKADWMYLVDVVGVTNSSNYILQNGLPTLHIFGVGLSTVEITDVNGMQRLINWLRSPSSGKYRVWLLGGIPSQWRTQGGDSRKGDGWKKIFHSMDGIAPWHVARYSDSDEFDDYFQETIAVDAAYCKERGIVYMPTMWPGFSWLNLKKDVKKGISINSIPREGGKFMWRMAYKYVSNPNINSIWVAQFDEVDESTAIFKVTSSTIDNPLPSNGWLALDADGTSLPSDWYLRLTGEAQLMLEGKRTLTSAIPLNPNVPHIPLTAAKLLPEPATSKPTTSKPTTSKPTASPRHSPTTKPTVHPTIKTHRSRQPTTAIPVITAEPTVIPTEDLAATTTSKRYSNDVITDTTFTTTDDPCYGATVDETMDHPCYRRRERQRINRHLLSQISALTKEP